MTEIFFQLIQVALGRRTALERTLTAAEWNELYQMVKKQVLVGIGFVGMQRLPSEQWPDRSLVLKWNKAAQKLEDKNNDLNKRCEALCRRFQQDDFWVCVLNAQSWRHRPVGEGRKGLGCAVGDRILRCHPARAA